MKRLMWQGLSMAVTAALAVTLLASCNPKNPDSSAPGDISGSGSEPSGSGASIGTTAGVSYAEDGLLVYPYGRISMPVTGDRDLVGLQNAQKKSVWNKDGSESSTFQENTADIRHQWESGEAVDTKVTATDDGCLTVKQTAHSENGVSSVSFSITVPNRYDLILPIWGGVRLTAEQPDIDLKFTRLTYPDIWQAQMFLIQGTNGGLLVYAQDDASQFKALNVHNDDENFYLTIETIPQAPFDQYKEFETVEWKMVPYKGDWQEGAALYREYADKLFDLPAIQAKKPEWASQIQLAVLTDIEDEPMLAELAKKVDPKKTLLIVPGWRKAEYDTAYPDYTPKEGIKEKIKYAQGLGYRVAVHFNFLGAALDSPEYTGKLKDAHSLDAFTKEPIIESYDAFGKTFAFSQLNPASTVWQEVLVEKTKETVKELGVDGIHLDQSLLCFNDGRGLVNGMTSMQGTIAMQKALAEALPGIAFSGEGINELNMQYSSWLQVHVYGLDSDAQTWDDSRFNQICPLTTVLYGDYTSLYHYPAMPTTEPEQYYQAWYRAGNWRTGHIPTLMRINAAQVSNPNQTMELVLKEAKWYQDNQPKINKDAWEEDVMLSLKCQDGTIAEYRRDTLGEVFIPDASKPDNAMNRFITGVVNAKLPGTIQGWKIFDKDFLRGLNPLESYLYDETPRKLTVSHIDTIPENLTVRDFTERDAYTAISLKEIEDTSKIVTDFMRFNGPIRAGEVLNSGDSHAVDGEFNSMNAFWYTLDAQGQARHLGDRFLMHPPWKDEGAGIGYTYMEFDVPLQEVGNAIFEAGVQMASAENARVSDGVVFKFFIWEKGDDSKTGMVTQELHAKTASPLPVSLDIAKFEGKTVTIRIEAHPYETVSNDSAVVVSPKVIQRKASTDRSVTYTVTSDKAVQTLLSASGKASMKSLGGSRYEITANLSDTVYLVHSKTAAQLPADLTMLPFSSSWVYSSGDVTSPSSDLVPAIQVAEVKGELRQGIFAHPPADGRCEIHYLLTLPSSGEVVFTGAVGLKKGSDDSNGVTFGIEANGKSLWSKKVTGNQSFQEFSVSLKGYAGQTVLLTLTTDAGGSNAYDLAFWGDPYLDMH